MKKICIISELSTSTVNYGNVLQAYALNKYINDNNSEIKAYSLYDALYFSLFDFYNTYYIGKEFISKVIHHNFMSSKVRIRNERFKEFINNYIVGNSFKSSAKDFKNSKYDGYIVGSDVVWAQKKGTIDKIRFLYYPNNDKFSYSASFGNNMIPNCNVEKIKRELKKFSLISVRERDAVDLLRDIGINNVVQCVDPTLLFDDKHWGKLATEPKSNKFSNYIFTYFLGKDSYQRRTVTEISRKYGLPIVNIPFANGENNEVDNSFADIKLYSCSPNEWLWLIQNAEYFFTDSFHGMVFSLIFKTKFIVLKRSGNSNARLNNFANLISQEDKIISFDSVNDIFELERLQWNYEKSEANIAKLRENSIDYIRKIIESIK